MFQSILWDFDGTLVNTYPAIAHAVNTALATFGKAASMARVIELSSISLHLCIKTLAADYDLPFDDLDARFTQAYGTITPADQPPFPGIVSVCEYCIATHRQCFIVTHRRRASLHKLLTAYDLGHYFADIVAGDDGFPRKPDPAACIHLIEKYHLDRTATLMVGDRDVDVLAGQAAGVKTCLFGTPFPNITPDFTTTSFDTFSGILDAK